MNYLEIAKVISELGVLVVCAGLVITMCWNNFKNGLNKDSQNSKHNINKDSAQEDRFTALLNALLEQQQEMQKSQQEQLDSLINKIVTGVTKHTLSGDENNSLALIEAQVNSTLNKTLAETNAARVCVVRFHNGGRDLNGLSFLKMSMTNEVVTLGLSPLMPDFQNLFRSFFSSWCGELTSKGFCYIDYVEDVKNSDAVMYEFLKSRGIQSKYGIALENRDKTVIGFICIEFLDKDLVNKEKVISCLHDKKIEIETLLNLK